MKWRDVLAHLRRGYRVGDEAADWVELWWTFREDEQVVNQHQTLRSGQALGEPCVVIAAEVEGGSSMSPHDALRHNATLAIGALAEEDDRLVVRALVPEATLTPAGLDRALGIVAHEAARLSLAARPAFNPSLFLCYCD